MCNFKFSGFKHTNKGMGNRLKEFDREARKSRSDLTNFILCFVQRAQSNFYAFVILFYQLMLAYRLMEKSNGDDLVCNCTFHLHVQICYFSFVDAYEYFATRL